MATADLSLLRECLGKRRKVQITRSIPSEQHHNGFVLGLSEELVLVYKFHDFYPEGCSVLRVEDIEAIRSDEHERLWERMLAREGLLDQVGIGAVPPLDDMESLLEHLCESQRPVIVEAEALPDEDEDNWAFLIGRVARITDGEAWIRHFDGLGNWEQELIPVEISCVTQVQIETPYLSTFLRHIPRFIEPESGHD